MFLKKREVTKNGTLQPEDFSFKERVFFCEIPFMTEKGTFIFDGPPGVGCSGLRMLVEYLVRNVNDPVGAIATFTPTAISILDHPYEYKSFFCGPENRAPGWRLHFSATQFSQGFPR